MAQRFGRARHNPEDDRAEILYDDRHVSKEVIGVAKTLQFSDQRKTLSPTPRSELLEYMNSVVFLMV